MFADGYERASKFTAPVAISSRTVGGKVETGLASFVIVNRDGWILTAAHVFQAMIKGQADAAAIKSREGSLGAIDANDNLTESKKKVMRRRVPEDKSWLANVSYWWAMDGRDLVDIEFDWELDLAVGRLEPFDPGSVSPYPIFHPGTDEVRPGTSVCRLGFPFHEIATTFDPATGFEFPPGTLPLARFPNDGIITREVTGPMSTAGILPQFIETSTPGLRGQSGGPVFDVEGVVYGIQSRTNFLELGFEASVRQGGRTLTEHQFLNVGIAVHPRTIADFLALHKVDVATT